MSNIKWEWDKGKAASEHEVPTATSTGTTILNTNWINPWVHFKLRKSEVDRVERLIDRDEAKPVIKDGHDLYDETEERIACPTCGQRVYPDENFCKACGQRLDQTNYGL